MNLFKLTDSQTWIIKIFRTCLDYHHVLNNTLLVIAVKLARYNAEDLSVLRRMARPVGFKALGDSAPGVNVVTAVRPG